MQNQTFNDAKIVLNENRASVLTSEFPVSTGVPIYQYNSYLIFPGFVDVHVHLREPGYFYKETISSGTAAATHGGYTAVCAMPNLLPAPDSMDNLSVELDLIKKKALIPVYPYGTITKSQSGKQLSDMEDMADSVVAFSDDGKGVQNGRVMLDAMRKAKSLGKIIAAHCEDESLLHGGYIHDGVYASTHSHRGISSESEWKQIERDLELVAKTGCKYHVCHVSTKESVSLLRKAKEEGLDVSCETAPHYLLLNDSQLQENGYFKMNPPIRSEEDQQALIAGIKDGTIDMIATDHAPHAAAEKSAGLEKSLMGVTGLETAFPVLYTGLVKTGFITLQKLIELMSISPRRRFNIRGGIEEGDFTVYDLNAEYAIDPETFKSKGRATPFAGNTVFGKCVMTVQNGNILWHDNAIEL